MKKFSDYVKQNGKGKGTLRKTVSGQFKICKRDNGKHRVFGYAIASTDEKGNVGLQGHTVSAMDFELAIYEFLQNMPVNESDQPASVIESCVFTKEKQKAIGIPPGILPSLAYWIGFEINDPAIWEMIKTSEFPVFTIEITGNAAQE